jgi:hypothetical protein
MAEWRLGGTMLQNDGERVVGNVFPSSLLLLLLASLLLIEKEKERALNFPVKGLTERCVLLESKCHAFISLNTLLLLHSESGNECIPQFLTLNKSFIQKQMPTNMIILIALPFIFPIKEMTVQVHLIIWGKSFFKIEF